MNEQDIAEAWAAVAAKERSAHARQWPAQYHRATSEEHKRNGRKGAAAVQAKRQGETPSQKACNRAMFRARHHPPLRSRDLVEVYRYSDTFARRVIRQLAEEKRIKLVGHGPQGEKLWEAVE